LAQCHRLNRSIGYLAMWAVFRRRWPERDPSPWTLDRLVPQHRFQALRHFRATCCSSACLRAMPAAYRSEAAFLTRRRCA